jgi:hypothetical protein
MFLILNAPAERVTHVLIDVRGARPVLMSAQYPEIQSGGTTGRFIGRLRAFADTNSFALASSFGNFACLALARRLDRTAVFAPDGPVTRQISMIGVTRVRLPRVRKGPRHGGMGPAA